MKEISQEHKEVAAYFLSLKIQEHGSGFLTAQGRERLISDNIFTRMESQLVLQSGLVRFTDEQPQDNKEGFKTHEEWSKAVFETASGVLERQSDASFDYQPVQQPDLVKSHSDNFHVSPNGVKSGRNHTADQDTPRAQPQSHAQPGSRIRILEREETPVETVSPRPAPRLKPRSALHDDATRHTQTRGAVGGNEVTEATAAMPKKEKTNKTQDPQENVVTVRPVVDNEAQEAVPNVAINDVELRRSFEKLISTGELFAKAKANARGVFSVVGRRIRHPLTPKPDKIMERVGNDYREAKLDLVARRALHESFSSQTGYTIDRINNSPDALSAYRKSLAQGIAQQSSIADNYFLNQELQENNKGVLRKVDTFLHRNLFGRVLVGALGLGVGIGAVSLPQEMAAKAVGKAISVGLGVIGVDAVIKGAQNWSNNNDGILVAAQEPQRRVALKQQLAYFHEKAVRENKLYQGEESVRSLDESKRQLTALAEKKLEVLEQIKQQKGSLSEEDIYQAIRSVWDERKDHSLDYLKQQALISERRKGPFRWGVSGLIASALTMGI